MITPVQQATTRNPVKVQSLPLGYSLPRIFIHPRIDQLLVLKLVTLAMDNHLNNPSVPIFRHANSLKAITAHDFYIPLI